MPNHWIIYSVLSVTLWVDPLIREQCAFWEWYHIIIEVLLRNNLHFIKENIHNSNFLIKWNRYLQQWLQCCMAYYSYHWGLFTSPFFSHPVPIAVLKFISSHLISRSNKSDYHVTPPEEYKTVYLLSTHHHSQKIRLSRNPISIAYYSLFSVNPSSEPKKKIITSPHHQRILQFIYCHLISRANKLDYTVTPSADPIKVYLPSPHQKIR